MNKCYSELITIPTFIERYRYLRLGGKVGEDTFGFDRYLNQIFYKDPEWLRTRDLVIIRDGGCDLAMPDREILSRILVHHINPITKEDILKLCGGVKKIRQEVSLGETHDKDYKKDKIGAILTTEVNLLSNALKEKKSIYDGF